MVKEKACILPSTLQKYPITVEPFDDVIRGEVSKYCQLHLSKFLIMEMKNVSVFQLPMPIRNSQSEKRGYALPMGYFRP